MEMAKRRRLRRAKRKNAPTPFGILVGFLLLGSLFTTVVGTFLQILGVYRNCLCDIPISPWQNGDFLLAISTNTRDDIYYAQKFWLPTGVASICLMIVVCYIGWWYQRHWRSQFKDAVEQLLGPEPPKEIKREAESTQGANAKSGLFRRRNAPKRATTDATTQTSDPTKGPISDGRSSVDDAQAGPASGDKKESGTTTTEKKGDEISQG
jgi:hypothetical protein